MERVFKVVIYILIIAALITASSFYFAKDFYHRMVAEDGFFENVTAIVLLCISVLSIIRFIKVRKNRNRYWMLFSLLIILGAFFGFGEEISWGQRIFNIESGEFFTQKNLQNETNLHNLEINGININKLIFSQALVLVLGFYFLFAQLLYKRWNYFKKLIDILGVPIPLLKHTIIILVCTGFILLVPDLRIWELWEAMFVLIILLVFLEPMNKEEKLIMS